jgi:hypothetical protein
MKPVSTISLPRLRGRVRVGVCGVSRPGRPQREHRPHGQEQEALGQFRKYNSPSTRGGNHRKGGRPWSGNQPRRPPRVRNRRAGSENSSPARRRTCNGKLRGRLRPR